MANQNKSNQNQEESIVYKIQLLEELVERQQKTLMMANNLLDIKSRLVELCEEEVEIYKKECKRLRRSLIISGVIFALLAIINLTRLLA
jgi:hypothetical protein